MKTISSHDLCRQITSCDLPEGQIALWSLGQVGFVIKSSQAQASFAIDPYLTDSIESSNPGTEFVRAFPPPLDPENLSLVDIVFVTHEHDDHLDPSTISRALAAKPELKVVAPAALVKKIRSFVPEATVVGAQEGQAFEIGGLKVLPLAAAHPVPELDQEGRSLRLGYLIEINGCTVFHAGDTYVFDGLCDALKPICPDVMILPINGGDYFRSRRNIVANMNYREAADLAALVGCDLLVPSHFDLFPNNRDRPSFFVDYLLEQHSEVKFHMFTVGERFIYQKK
jgi:L-ascorbate metabolism protein UlaG (beta-lactamase superfamily)